MHRYDYDNNKKIYDGIKEFCQCERVNEEYMRALLVVEKKTFFKNIVVALKMKYNYFNQIVLNSYKKVLSKI